MTQEIVRYSDGRPAYMSETELMHYGVLGMKWGKRKDRGGGVKKGKQGKKLSKKERGRNDPTSKYYRNEKDDQEVRDRLKYGREAEANGGIHPSEVGKPVEMPQFVLTRAETGKEKRARYNKMSKPEKYLAKKEEKLENKADKREISRLMRAERVANFHAALGPAYNAAMVGSAFATAGVATVPMLLARKPIQKAHRKYEEKKYIKVAREIKIDRAREAVEVAELRAKYQAHAKEMQAKIDKKNAKKRS